MKLWNSIIYNNKDFIKFCKNMSNIDRDEREDNEFFQYYLFESYFKWQARVKQAKVNEIRHLVDFIKAETNFFGPLKYILDSL